jgi:hypothetical protein
MRMPVIGAAIGGLALGATMVAGSRYMTTPVQASIPAPSLGSTQLVSQGAGLGSNPVLVDCADGQRALVRHVSVAGQTVAQVQCVGQPLVTTNTFDDMSTAAAAPAYTTARAYPVSMSRPAASYTAPAPVRTRTAAARQPVYRTASEPVYRTASEPVYRTTSSEAPVKTPRSWKKSALIIGGSAAGGAGVGAILDGKSGAKKGAIVGGIAGTVYDIATRNK